MPGRLQKTAAAGKPSKPAKPHRDFPLFAHASGRWAKKIRGAFAYFGKWADDPQGKRALALWLEQKDYLLAGQTPPAAGVTGVSVKDLCDAFLTAKEQRVQSGELTLRSFNDYLKTAQQLAAAFGKSRLVADLTPADFAALRAKWGRLWGPVTLGNEIGRARVLFRWGFDSELLDKPVRVGKDFARPSKKTMRLARAEKGPRLFSAAELRAIIDHAEPRLRAMTLLGINCALGNSDCANLRIRHVDLDAGWLDYPRPKTGIPRRCPLWRETIDAVQSALALRPAAKLPADADLVFLTRCGAPWRVEGSHYSPVSVEFRKVLTKLGIERPGLGLYTLRHQFQTVGGATRDADAVSSIMGHAAHAGDMAAVYREGVDDDRLHAVVDYVHRWLFNMSKPKPR